MNIIRWAAVAVTGLFALMNLGAAIEADGGWVRIVGAALCIAGAAAAVGLALYQSWGRPAVITVGALNMTGAVAALLTDEAGFVAGMVVGGLGVLLGALAGPRTSPNVAVAR